MYFEQTAEQTLYGQLVDMFPEELGRIGSIYNGTYDEEELEDIDWKKINESVSSCPFVKELTRLKEYIDTYKRAKDDERFLLGYIGVNGALIGSCMLKFLLGNEIESFGSLGPMLAGATAINGSILLYILYKTNKEKRASIAKAAECGIKGLGSKLGKIYESEINRMYEMVNRVMPKKSLF
jgi:hypothetical protein